MDKKKQIFSLPVLFVLFGVIVAFLHDPSCQEMKDHLFFKKLHAVRYNLGYLRHYMNLYLKAEGRLPEPADWQKEIWNTIEKSPLYPGKDQSNRNLVPNDPFNISAGEKQWSFRNIQDDSYGGALRYLRLDDRRFILASRGPDKDIDLSEAGEIAPQTTATATRTNHEWAESVAGKRYDPTNGVESNGDIFVFSWDER